MKNTPNRKHRPKSDEMRPEYEFDYAKARQNRFAQSMKKGAVAVVLDPDVAAVFQTSESVNAMLRSVLSALPVDAKPKPTGD
jgi:hypothetical protein